ncbi:putative F-box protein At5g55150 [Nicotiana tabacum]|uniref:F-box protein At5g55150 n=1 Tax=Nicotiana tabacum TaxID=4097 RepID=A0A1S4C1R5_TOBAC|nr:PREDICTED: uncharacterized protein LOC107814235 [Nicotiana tabacum]
MHIDLRTPLPFVIMSEPGDLRWTRIRWEQCSHSPYGDVVYFNGHFYAVDYLGRVLVCDVAGPKPTRSHIVAQLPGDRLHQLYILESLGSLFVVVRDGVQVRHVKDDCDRIPLTILPESNIKEDVTYGTTNFRVFQVDLAAGKATQTRELGDSFFFLVLYNASLSVQASQFPGIKPNFIYFTDDFWETYLAYAEGGGLDMGVFYLADGSIQPHYKGVSLSRVCPPTWVTPTVY